MRMPRARGGSGMEGPSVRRSRAAAALVLCLVAAALVLPPRARPEIVVKLEVIAETAAVHLEPSGGSPILETLTRGTVVKQSSAHKFRTNWIYILFISSRSGRTLAGYIADAVVRKLTSTIKVIDLTPAENEIADPKEFDLTATRLPEAEWGRTKEGILRTEGRPLSREISGDLEFLRYHRNVFGKRCLITYVLADRRLSSIRVHLLERYADKDRYIADYNKIRDFLNGKVGEPRYDNVVWKDRAYAESGEKLGLAVTSGCLSLSSEWVSGGTGLRLSLTGENSEILFAAEINDITGKNSASF